MVPRKNKLVAERTYKNNLETKLLQQFEKNVKLISLVLEKLGPRGKRREMARSYGFPLDL